jgi:hypothetical protein
VIGIAIPATWALPNHLWKNPTTFLSNVERRKIRVIRNPNVFNFFKTGSTKISMSMKTPEPSIVCSVTQKKQWGIGLGNRIGWTYR